MITKLHNDSGYIMAMVEWQLVGQSGYQVPSGEYIWLQNLWIHKDHRGRGLLQELIAQILLICPKAKYGYFTREKYNNRMSKAYPRNSVERIAQLFEGAIR